MRKSSFIPHHSSFAEGVTLYAQFAASAKLGDVIRQNLKGLGYEA